MYGLAKSNGDYPDFFETYAVHTFSAGNLFLAWVESGRESFRELSKVRKGLKTIVKMVVLLFWEAQSVQQLLDWRLRVFWRFDEIEAAACPFFWGALLLRLSKNWQAPVKTCGPANPRNPRCKAYKGRSLAFLVLTILETKVMLKAIPRKTRHLPEVYV